MRTLIVLSVLFGAYYFLKTKENSHKEVKKKQVVSKVKQQWKEKLISCSSPERIPRDAPNYKASRIVSCVDGNNKPVSDDGSIDSAIKYACENRPYWIQTAELGANCEIGTNTYESCTHIMYKCE